MEKYHKRALTRALEDLVENLDVEKVTTHLQAQEIIDERDVQEMSCEKTRHKKVQMLISIIKTRGRKAFPTFINALRKYPFYHYLADNLGELADQAMRESMEQGKLNF